MPRNLFGTWESTLDMGGAQVWGGSSGAVLLLRKEGPVRELNPGPLATYARIIPLDQQAVRVNVYVIFR